MATSSKVMFKLESLQAKATESINLRIAQAQLHVDSFDDDDALALRVTQWREQQVAKVTDLYQRLTDAHEGVDDYRLSKFKLDDIPEVDRYDRRSAERKLVELEGLKSKIEAKASSLVADADGNISLTTTQLNEFFAL